MARFLVNLVVSLAVILAATWLSKRHAGAAGFVAALPVTTMLVLLLGRMDGVGADEQATFAKSMLAGIPLGASFLLPFLAAPRLGLSFGAAFGVGVLFVAAGYVVHRWLLGG